jgi:hypothetical protein
VFSDLTFIRDKGFCGNRCKQKSDKYYPLPPAQHACFGHRHKTQEMRSWLFSYIHKQSKKASEEGRASIHVHSEGEYNSGS